MPPSCARRWHEASSVWWPTSSSPKAPSQPTASELRSFLGGKLPEYMVPSVFVPLAALPISPNGKVDRKALPAPDSGRSEFAAEYVAPSSPTEIKMAAMWSDVLRSERVGLRDNFFELGGHSLLATQVLARVRAEFDVELPLRKLFESPVLADFAGLIDAAERAKLGPSLEHVAHDGTSTLSYSQLRLWFFDQLEPGNPVYHVSTAVRLTGRSIARSGSNACSKSAHGTIFSAQHSQPATGILRPLWPRPWRLNVRDYRPQRFAAAEREERARDGSDSRIQPAVRPGSRSTIPHRATEDERRGSIFCS